MNDDIIQKQKSIILPNGGIKKIGGDKKKVVSEDGREITDPIVVSAKEFTDITAAVQAFPMLRDMIILLRAGMENEIEIFKQRGDISLAETAVQKRLEDILEIAEAHLGPMPKVDQVVTGAKK